MSERKVIAIEAAIVAAGVLALAFQVFRVWSRWGVVREVREFNKAARGASPEAAAEAALRLSAEIPSEPALRLVRARWLLAAGRREQAISEYTSLASRSRSPELKAMAELGLGAALLGRQPRPTEEDIKAALGAFERAGASCPGLADIAPLKAAAFLWSGDRAAAETAVARPAKTLSMEAEATLFCVKAVLAAYGGDLTTAAAEYRKVLFLFPQRTDPLGAYAASGLEAVEFEQALAPNAPAELRAKLVKRLTAEGAKALSEPSLRHDFIRAAVACRRWGSAAERQLGADLLAKALADGGKDRTLLLLQAALAAEELMPLWEKAAAGAPPSAKISSYIELLPGAPPGGAEPASGKKNVALAQLVAGEASVLKPLREALSEAASDAGSAGEALGLAEYLFRWKVRQAELSATPQERAASELAAAEIVEWAAELLGERMPRTADAARLLRNAGLIYWRRLQTDKALALFKRSLQFDPQQEDLRGLLEGEGARPVATYPAGDRLQPMAPLVGAEFYLPPEVGSLARCKVEAFVGPKGGELAPVKPIVSSAGVWWVASQAEMPEGLLEARFVVTDPAGRKSEARSVFRVDVSPPEIVRREPAPGGRIADRQPLIRILWKDAGGLDPDSVEVTLEPVKADAVRQQLVVGGRQKGPRLTPPVEWRARAPAVSGAEGGSGEILTSPSSELPPGVYRVRVSMRDPFQHHKEDSWTFTVD